jgi:hypothetical protein
MSMLDEHANDERRNEGDTMWCEQPAPRLPIAAPMTKEEIEHRRRMLEHAFSVTSKCPWCGQPFKPKTHNQKFCSYQCRWDNQAEVRKMKHDVDT